jgi:hypothetical protein
VGADKFVGKAFQTDDYAEDASGNPIAGFKAYAGSYGGTPQFKVGPLGGRVGKESLNEAAVAAVSALARTGYSDNDRVWYRGNSFGAPVLMDPAWSSTKAYAVGNRVLYSGNVYRCTLARSATATVPTSDASHWTLVGTMASQERLMFSAAEVVRQIAPGGWYYYQFIATLRPRAITDNLDGMRELWLDLYTSAGAQIRGFPVTVSDRAYLNSTIDNDAQNESRTSFDLFLQSAYTATGAADVVFNGFIRVTARNSIGQSSRDYAAGAPFTGGATIPAAGSTPPTTEPSNPTDTGTCVAPETLVTMANAARTGPGIKKPIGSCRAGEWVWTRHEFTGEWGAFPITHHSVHEAERVRVRTTDGRAVKCSDPHRLAVGAGWREADTLGAGVLIDGTESGTVDSVERADRGPVVSMTVGDAHTYLTEGLLSHNVKIRG